MARPSTVVRLGEILAAAEHWKTKCLVADGSVFTDNPLWSARNMDLLDQFFIQNPLEGETSFIEKLRTQLDPAPGEVKQLAAEMLWILLMFPSKISGDKSVRIFSKSGRGQANPWIKVTHCWPSSIMASARPAPHSTASAVGADLSDSIDATVESLAHGIQ
jgi:hypothetical protein